MLESEGTAEATPCMCTLGDGLSDCKPMMMFDSAPEAAVSAATTGATAIVETGESLESVGTGPGVC